MDKNVKICIIGGHGKVALLLHPLLVEGGHEVSALIRNQDHAEEVDETGAQSVVADVETMDAEALAAQFAGFDAVIWSAGAGGGNPDRTYAVDRDAAIRAIDAAKQAEVPRFVMVSYVGSGRDEVPEDNPFHHYATAKAAADEHLRASGLAYTILGPGALTLDEPTGRIDVLERGVRHDRTEVSRADVAAVIAAVLVDDATIGRTIDFRSGDTPIEEAIRA